MLTTQTAAEVHSLHWTSDAIEAIRRLRDEEGRPEAPFRVDVRLVNTETGEIVKTESERMQRDHMFDIIRNIAARLMKDANLPALQRQASEQRMGRQVPTEALTYYSRALLYSDHGQKDKAVEMFNRALAIFPDYAEAQEGLQRVQRS